jgi:outer membrane receptor for ferrienterochelin and colicins
MKASHTLGWTALVLSVATSAAADDAELEALLSEKIVTTASRTAETGSTAPATVSSISAQDLRRFGIRNLADAVNFLSLGMFAQESPVDGQEFGARGVALSGGNNAHVLLLINGHTVNDQLTSVAGAAQYGGMPLDLVDHIEIVLGPGAVLYGANAMLGVINVITKDASTVGPLHVIAESYFSPPPTRGADPAHRGSYWSDSGRAARVAAFGGYAFRLFDRPAEVSFELQYAHRDAPAYSHAFPIGPATKSHTETLRVGLPSAFARLLVGDFELNVRAARSIRATTIPDGTWMYVSADGPYGPARTDGTDQWLNLDLKYSKSLSRMVAVNGRLFGDVGESVRTSITYDAIISCDVWMPVGCRHEQPISARWAGGELQTSFRWLEDNSLTTMVGVTGTARRIEGSVNYFELSSGTGATYNRFRLNEVAGAAYLQQVWHAATWLDINAGARWDYEERFGDKVSPRAAVIIKPWSGSSIKAVYSEAFRGPSIREAFVTDPSRRMLAGSLKPEGVRSVEATLEQQFGVHRLMYGVFRTWWSDVVASRSYIDVVFGATGAPPEDVRIMGEAKARGELFAYVLNGVQYQNLAAIDNYGLQAAYSGSALERRLQFGVNAVVARAYRSGMATDFFLSTAPVVSGNARISYDLHPSLATVGLASQLLGERYAESAYAALFPKPPKAPAQVELRLTVSGQVPGLSQLRYQIAGGYAFSPTSSHVATMPPLYPGFAAAPLVLRPIERYMTMLGIEYEF